MHADGHRDSRTEPAATDTAHQDARPTTEKSRASSRAKWVFLGFLAISAFFLIVEHRAHVFGLLPWLILLACPLMHLFMHHGHGGHRHGSHGGGKGEDG